MADRPHVGTVARLPGGQGSRETHDAAEALFRSAITLRSDPARAVELLNNAISIDPYRACFRYHRGLAWQRATQFDKAIADFETVLKQNPDNVRVRHQLALALLEAGRFADARKQWMTAESAIKSKSVGPFQDRALFKVGCGRVLALLYEKGTEKALDELVNLRAPPGCESLASELAFRLLVSSAESASIRKWIESAVDRETRQAVLGPLKQWLIVTDKPPNERVLDLTELDCRSASARQVRALLAFDAAKAAGDPAILARLRQRHSGDEWAGMAHVAALHTGAAAAYADKKWDAAARLWAEALSSDPYNPAIIQNLALTATRAADIPGYERHWNRLQRIWYTNSVISPEVGRWLNAAAQKHLAFASKAADEVRKSPPKSAIPHTLWVWIDEMERHLLAEHFGFKSALHLFGITPATTQDAADEAYAALKSKVLRYADLALPELKDELRQLRIGTLDDAWRSIGTSKARRLYSSPDHDDESLRARAVRERRATYLISLAEFVERRWKDFGTDAQADYRKLVDIVLAHPWSTLQRYFEDASKLDSRTLARDWIRDLLSDYYTAGIVELAKKAQHSAAHPAWKRADSFLEDLRGLAPSAWHKRYSWAFAERTLGNVDQALTLLRQSREDCESRDQIPDIDKLIRDTERDRERVAVLHLQNAAIEAINGQRWEEGLQWLTQALERSPGLIDLHLYAAHCELQMKKLTEAADRINRTPAPAKESQRAQWLQLRQGLAVAHMNASDWPKAIEELDKAMAVEPDDAALWALRSNCCLGRSVEAMNKGDVPPRKSSISEARRNLLRARASLNARKQKAIIKNVAKQLRAVDKKLKK
jgi:tetratricopeptide (TPR) repeat protein